MSKFKYLNLALLLSIQLSFGEENRIIKLPELKKDSDFSIEKAISQRRSTRSFSSRSLTLNDISTLLWAGQGITSKSGLRAAPSAEALYPIELYLVAYNVDSLFPGIYKYYPFEHSLRLIKKGNFRNSLSTAALGQECIRDSAAVVVISAVFERTTKKYGERGRNYVYFEAGCVAENIHLLSERLGIGTVVVGAFFDEDVKNLISLEKNEVPIALMPIGYKK